ncbi:AraC family transcriptional regulator [Elizabethkingia miricola]|uniref:helix-turn-helix domain-containing protein n=1 Tax=Elizabethkingia miricola TaxID=172045 RepID=UPI0020113F8F|nr:AraC family transcriptional regulator [Elizabethkingia miricola]MCL1680593.1 AraC family transcriptional regulator [Elizabethkingia miricola]
MEPEEQTYNNYRLPVPREFEDVFSHFYIAENTTEVSLTKTLLPSFQTIMVFNFGALASLISKQGTAIEMDKCIVLGPIKQAFEYSLPAGAKILVANFKGDAFYRFFGTAFLSDHLPIHPDEAMEENCFTCLWRQLNSIDADTAKIDRILDFCRPYLKSQNTVSSLLNNFKSGHVNSIKSVAEEMGQSERNVQLAQKKYFGYSAKEVNRYQRFIKAVGFFEQVAVSTNKIDWFEIIGQCGYYDQSQLIHDFQHFLGFSPKTFLKFQQDICQAAPD